MGRYGCDIASAENPGGIRLTSLLAALDSFFPTAWGSGTHGDRRFFSCLMRCIRGLSCGGWDVLLFFDFMSLPQIGRTASGDLIHRTEEEAALFSEALPSTGSLYTMYPVLVACQVTSDTHPYWSSGWCTSEFFSALITGQLCEYSSEVVKEYTEIVINTGELNSNALIDALSSNKLTEEGVASFLQALETDLATKVFSDEADRAVVFGIVKGYTLKRSLVDAVKARHLS